MAKKFFRDATLESGAPGVDTGIFRLSFSSELPTLRSDKKGKYWEVISHNPGDVNLAQLNRQGIVLENHDDKKELGEVVRNSAKVEADKKTRASIKLFDGAWLTRAKTAPSDISVSVGYFHISVLEETEGADGIPVRRFAWKPYEVSLLTVEPVDLDVGINRSMKRKCTTCDGEGRCRCRSKEDDEADEDCEDCGGDGDCSDCDGDGYFTSARSSKVDLSTISAKQFKTLQTKFMIDDNKIMPEEALKRANEAATKAVTDAKAFERANAKEISVAADEFIKKHGLKDSGKCADKLRDMANAAIEAGEQAKDFNSRAMQHVLNAEPVKVQSRDFVPQDEMAQFSVMRSIQSAIKNLDAGRAPIPDEKELEGSVIKEYTKRCYEAGGAGGQRSGFMLPPDAQFGTAGMSRKDMLSHFRSQQNKFGRDMQSTVFGSGGAAVPTYWLLPYIELLRNKSVLNRVGIRSMAGLTGNVIIPRLEAPSTAYSVAEIAALTASQQTIGQVVMTPKRIGTTEVYSKQLLFQSSPDMEGLIRDDNMTVLALKKDELGLNGQGSASEPLGVMNSPGISTVTFGATPTYIKMIAFETAIRQLNVMGPLAYCSTSKTKGSLKGVAEALTGATTIGGSQNAIWKRGIGGTGMEDGEVNGYQAVDSQQIPNDLVLAGMFNDLIEGIWGGFDVVVDYYTKASNAEIVLTMNMWFDIALRHPQSFCLSTDSGAQ